MTEPLPEVPFGAWPSPITAARLVEGAAGVGEVSALTTPAIPGR